MKFEVEHSQLIKALGHMQRVVERRNTIPILNNVMLSVEAGALTISGTDLDIELVETIPANVETSGVTTVAAHLFHAIIGKMATGATISVEGNKDKTQLVVRSGRSEFTLQTLDAD